MLRILRAVEGLVRALDVLQTEAFAIEFLAAFIQDVLQGAVRRGGAAGSLQRVQHGLRVAAGAGLAFGLDQVGLRDTGQREVGVADGEFAVAELAGEPAVLRIEVEREELAAVAVQRTVL